MEWKRDQPPIAEVELAEFSNHMDLGIKEKKKMGQELQSTYFLRPGDWNNVKSARKMKGRGENWPARETLS